MAAELDECSGSEPSCFNELEQDNGSRLPPAQQSPLSAACQRMIAQKHYHRANDGNNHAPDVETGYALHADRAEENSSDNRTDDTQGDIEPKAFAAFVDNLAANKASNEA